MKARHLTTKPRKLSPAQRAELQRRFHDPKRAAQHLSAALDKGEAVFLPALKDVAVARGGMGPLGRVTKLNREGLYKMLSKRGNPRLSSLVGILAALGLKLQAAPRARR